MARGTPLANGAIPVDELGRTELPGVYAAGDALPCLRPTAATSAASTGRPPWRGRRRGARDPRADPPPTPLPGFWSDQYGRGSSCVGRPAGADAVSIDGDPNSRAFAARFLQRGRPVAALLVDRAAELAHHRRQIQAGIQTEYEREAA